MKYNTIIMYLAFDTETTGLAFDSQVLTAYFVILDKNLVKKDELELSIKYDTYHVSVMALLSNKIDLIKHHETSLTITKSTELFENFLRRNFSEEKMIPIGHNVNFDIKMITRKLISIENYKKYFNPVVIDTFVIAKELKHKNILKCDSLSLSKLCLFLNIITENNTNFHDAKYDTLMTVSLYKVLSKLIEDNSVPQC